MYPKNNASPEPIAIGAVVAIADGAVQTSGCTVRIKPIGVAEGDGAGTTAYSTDGIVLYTPTQGETNYTSFVLIAKKTGCIPVSITVVTSASATPGHGGVDWGVVINKTTTNALTGTTIATTQKVDVETIKTQSVACAASVTVLASVGTAATSTAQTGDTYALANGASGFVATKADTAAILVDTGTTLQAELDGIQADTEDIQTRLPAALTADGNIKADTLRVGGTLQTAGDISALVTTVDTVVDAIKTKTDQFVFTVANQVDANALSGGGGLDAAGVRSAVGLASANLDTQLADLPTNAEFNARTIPSADYFDPATDAVANVTTVATTTNLTNLPAIPTNWLTAAGLATDAVAEIQSGLATAANLATVAGYLDTEIAAILADTDELQTNQGNWLTATGFSTHSAADVWAVATRVLTAGTNIVLAKGTGVTGFNDIAATDIVSAGAITTLSGAVVNVDLVDTCTTNTDMRGTDSAYTGTPPTVGQIADQVWDEAIAGHAGVGSTGEALSAAGSAGDPWSTALPGAYGAGTAGKIIGDNIDAAITSRMASYTQPTGFLAATFPGTVASTTNITAATGITVATNSDKTGYSLTSAYDPAKTASQAGDAMALTSGERTTLAAVIWNSLTSGMSTVGSIGKKLADAVFNWATSTNVSDAQAAIIAQVDANEVKIDILDTILDAHVALWTSTIAGRIDVAVSSRSSHSAANVLTALGTGTWLTEIPWNAAWDAEVQSEVQDAIEVNHLDHLLAADYDPANKPGVSTALLNEIIGNDAGVSQFTANALELGPGGATAAAIAAAMFTANTGETYATSVAGSVVKEIADNAGVGAIENTVVISASAPSLTAINSGGTITIHRGDLTSFQLTDLGSLAGRTGEKIYFTVKAAEYTAASVDDTVATIQVTETTGATRLNGEATTASYGSITVDDETDGDITIALQHQLTTALPIADGYYYDVQMINSAGKPVTLTRGLLNVDADVTRSTT